MRVNPLYSSRDFKILGRSRPRMEIVRTNYFASITLAFCLTIAALLVIIFLVRGCSNRPHFVQDVKTLHRVERCIS